jgi:ABC-type bacteriocin/lantibiotic exporter with double-glycine peptidase domain
MEKRSSLVVLLCLALFPALHAQDPGASRSTPGQHDAQSGETQVETLRSDASWCGPRVLYFFSVYFGQEHTLDQVISLCKTDDRGYTSLLHLVEAAKKLDLEPTPVFCTAHQLLNLEGPAIITVNGPAGPGGNAPDTSANTGSVLHFVALIGREDDSYLVFNPGVLIGSYWVPREAIERDFTGHAVLLKGCPLPPMLPRLSWQVLASAIVTCGLIVVALLALTNRLPSMIVRKCPPASELRS